MKTQIRKVHKVGHNFKIGRGVWQGDLFSPNLFNSVLEEVFRGLDKRDKGIKIDWRMLNNLRFGDDLVLIGKNAKEVQEMFTEFIKCSNTAGLIINLEKTTLVVSNESTNEFITADTAIISKVSESKYLRKVITFEERQQREVKQRNG